VAVVDSGIEVSHPELRHRYVRELSMDALNLHREGDPIPVNRRMETHGTQAAGVCLSTRGNGVCGAGIAPGASLAVMRLLGLRSPTDAEEAKALSHKCQLDTGPAGTHGGHPTHVSVSSNSWGPVDDGGGLHGPSHLTEAAINACVHRVGRGGLGTVYVWAGGNGRSHADNINFDGYANKPETIAVGAIDDTGKQSWYSEPGACLMVTAPSSGAGLGIITSDPTGNYGLSAGSCTDSFGGTSASAPSASAVVAMMLQANPELGWRDVQHIFVRASHPIRMWEHRQPWAQNGAGFWHSHGIGFGLLNATKAVEMSLQWTNVPSPEVIAYADSLQAASTWVLRKDSAQNRYMEQVALTAEQKELKKLYHTQTEAEKKAEAHRLRKEKKRAETLAKSGRVWRALHWIGQKTLDITHTTWTSAISPIMARSKRDAAAYKAAWTPRDPFLVRVVKDRHGNPVGVAIPPGMGANFTMAGSWWDKASEEAAHQAGGKRTGQRKPAVTVLEHVGLRIYVNTPAGRGNLRIRLFSPAGTESVMSEGTSVNDRHMGIDGHKWTFWTVRCWGESTVGKAGWRLEVWNLETGQESPERDALRRLRGKPRESTKAAQDAWITRVRHPEQVDAVVRWWKLEARGTHT